MESARLNALQARSPQGERGIGFDSVACGNVAPDFSAESPDGRGRKEPGFGTPRAGLATGEVAIGESSVVDMALPRAAELVGAGAKRAPLAAPPRLGGGAGAFLPILPLGLSDGAEVSAERDFPNSTSLR